MFYSPQLLTSRKGGFAVVWLAASIGVKGAGGKKLTRKELLAVDLVQACEQVASPAEPLALRLSSSLLSGIARVYQQQFLFFSSDVIQVHQSLKKAFEDALISTDLTTTIDLAPAPARPLTKAGAQKAVAPPRLTLVKDPVIAQYGYDLDDQIDQEGWYLPGQDPRAPTPDIEIEGSFVASVEATPERGIPPRRPTGAYQARPADITLEEPHLEEYMLGELGAPRPEDFGTGEQLELGIFGEGEGLLEGEPELGAALRAAGAPSTSAGYEEQGDFFAGREFGGEMEGDLGGLGEMPFEFQPMEGVEIEGETAEARAAREHAEALAAREGAVAGVVPSSPALRPGEASPLEKILSETPSSGTRKRVSEVLGEVQEAQLAAAKKQKKAKPIPIDRRTELTDEAFRTSRATYNERMEAERKKTEKLQEEKESHQRAMDLIFGPPLIFQGPGLSDFWKNSLANQMVPFEGGKAVEAKKRLGRASPARQRLAAARAAAGRTPSPFLRAYSPAEVELGRRAPGTSPAARLSAEPAIGKEYEEGDFFAGREFGGEGEGADLGGMVEEYFPQEQVELGRGVSPGGAVSSTRPSLTPWAAEPGFEAAGVERTPSVGLGARVSLEQPQLPGMRRSRTPSLGLERAPSLAGFEGEGLEGLEEQLGQFPEGRLSRASPILSAQVAAQDLATLEQEAQKFLSYIRRVSSTLPTPSPPQERPPLKFSDLVPVGEATRSTAAQALYHTLSLAMKGVLKVRQEEAYGEIELRVRAGI
ncbi:uncharacterized protein JCM6883_004625 [Sporobolomyces salmoneus]|uniref:uncharacterized protein n=1 Tax=Sporobolomyces salmoneus TaxID=183962 RepID=UPI00317FBE84